MSEVSTVEGGATLSDLQNYINSNFTTQGVQASIATNSDGTSSLQLNSQMPGSAGTLTVNSSLVAPSTALAYTPTVTGANANLTVDGVNLTSASNTVTNLIPGVTFQLLAPSPTESGGSLEQVQVVIGNDNSGVESTVNQFVTDYNSLVSAINARRATPAPARPNRCWISYAVAAAGAVIERPESAKPERFYGSIPTDQPPLRLDDDPGRRRDRGNIGSPPRSGSERQHLAAILAPLIRPTSGSRPV